MSIQRKCIFRWPYETDALPEDTTGGKPKKDINGRLEPPHELHLPFPIPILVERMCLLLKNVQHFIRRVAGFQSGGEWVSRKVCPGLLGIRLQSSIEDGPELRI
jgi:hypothetical protein